jgi:hypothetical protein
MGRTWKNESYYKNLGLTDFEIKVLEALKKFEKKELKLIHRTVVHE